MDHKEYCISEIMRVLHKTHDKAEAIYNAILKSKEEGHNVDVQSTFYLGRTKLTTLASVKNG